ncbi:MAG: HAD family hydrolase [Bacteroidales bacterium]|nr:HAD family hydrolase [Bacteroidales bacterium]
MPTIRMVILDFDGTLADTAAVIIRTMQATISELGLPSRTDEQCAAMIGLRLVEIPPVLFPECSIDADIYARTYRRLFHEYDTEDAVKIYPAVAETLKTLKSKGIILTIASSRSHASLAEYVERLGLSSFISHILGADDVDKGKPDPEPVNRILERFGISPEETMVVGDTSFDIMMGRNAGTRTCGVTYGNGSMESLNDADRLIDDFGKLHDIIFT